jgi:DNA-binding IscR family transcriptional regulator
LVDAVRGVGGGYRFAGNAKRLTLMDVISLFEDVSADAADLPPQASKQEIAQALRTVLTEIDSHRVATLRSITLSTMLKLVARRQAAAVDVRPARRRAR